MFQKVPPCSSISYQGHIHSVKYDLLKDFRANVQGHSLTVGIVFLLMLSTVNGYYVAGQQQKEPPLPPKDAVKVQLDAGEQNTLQYNYTPGAPLALSSDNTNVVITANNQVQLQYTAENQLRIKYLGVDVESEKPLTLQVRGEYMPEEAPVASGGLGEYYMFQGTEAANLKLRAFVDAQDYAESLGRPVAQERLTWARWNGLDWTPVKSSVDEQGNLMAEGECGQWTIREMREGVLPDVVPGVGSQMRSQVKALNYTEVEPQGFRYSLGEGEETMFMFRNTMMVFNSIQPLQLNLSAENAMKSGAFGVKLETSKATMLNISMTATPTGGATEVRGIGVYMDIEHNATDALKASLAMKVDVEMLKAKYGVDFDPNQLMWAYWNGEMWMEVPSTLENDVLVAETDHFSIWTIVEVQVEAPIVETQVEAVIDAMPASDNSWVYVGGAMIAGFAVVALYLLKGRK